MANELDPIIDQWYFHRDKGQRFFVTAINDKAGTVEMQHFDGDLEEISLQDWSRLNIEVSAEPENWSGAMDIAEQDDLGTEVTDTKPADWTEPGKDYRRPEK